MTWEIGLTLALIVVTLVAFIRECAAPDVIGPTVLCGAVALELVPMDRMPELLENEPRSQSQRGSSSAAPSGNRARSIASDSC